MGTTSMTQHMMNIPQNINVKDICQWIFIGTSFIILY